MRFQTSLPILKDALSGLFEQGRFDAVRPECWAATHRRTVAEIAALMEAVRADRGTRSAPNAAPEPIGEGK